MINAEDKRTLAVREYVGRKYGRELSVIPPDYDLGEAFYRLTPGFYYNGTDLYEISRVFDIPCKARHDVTRILYKGGY